MTDNILQDHKRRADEARFLLAHPLIVAAFDKARASLARQRMGASTTDRELHSRLIVAEQVLNTVENYLREQVATGALAELRVKPTPLQRVLRR